VPRRAKGPYLYLDKARAQWVVRDGQRFVRTGCDQADARGAEKFLAEHIGAKYSPRPHASPLIADVLLAYSRDRVPHQIRADNAEYNVNALAAWWSDKSVSDISARTCREYAATRTASAADAHLKVLQAALRHWHAEYGPLAFMPTVWKPPIASTPRERWLTKGEAARLLWAARRTPYLARLILIGLYTGTRGGVVKALRWDWIDLKAGVMHRRAPGALDGKKKRKPPVKLGRKILGHLRRWRRLSPREVLVVHYDGRQMKNPHTSWDRVVKAAALEGRVTPHVLRHTRATWLMQAGIAPWQAAGSLGMSVKTLLAVYGHHHPDFQREAADI
jgi:integrase